DGAGLRHDAPGGAELRRRTLCARTHHVPPGGAAQQRADATADSRESVAAGPAHPAILDGTAGGGSGCRVPAHHFLEFRGHRADLCVLRHVPGARQRVAVAAELGVPGLHLRTARRVAVDAPGLHADAGLAPVGGERDPADADESVAAAARIPAKTRDSGAAARAERYGRFAGDRLTPVPGNLRAYFGSCPGAGSASVKVCAPPEAGVEAFGAG